MVVTPPCRHPTATVTMQCKYQSRSGSGVDTRRIRASKGCLGGVAVCTYCCFPFSTWLIKVRSIFSLGLCAWDTPEQQRDRNLPYYVRVGHAGLFVWDSMRCVDGILPVIHFFFAVFGVINSSKLYFCAFVSVKRILLCLCVVLVGAAAK